MTARLCAGLAALLVATPALPSEETEGTVPMSPAWLEAYEMQADVFMPEQRSLLSHLAWHAAVANICDGLFLDHARFGAALGGLEHTDAADMSDDELRSPSHRAPSSRPTRARPAVASTPSGRRTPTAPTASGSARSATPPPKPSSSGADPCA